MCGMRTEVIEILPARILERTWEIPHRCALVVCIGLAIVWARLVVALSRDSACTADCSHLAGGCFVGALRVVEVVILRMILPGARDLPNASLASCDSCAEQCDSEFVCVLQDQRSLSNPRLGLQSC